MENVTASRGFTLIEALIALLVLSIGLLGVAGMQLKALQGAHAGYQRAVASLAAQDAQERLWAQYDAVNDQCAELGSEEESWEAEWQAVIPSLVASVKPVSSGSDCSFTILLTWGDTRFDEGDSSFEYTARLPGSWPP